MKGQANGSDNPHSIRLALSNPSSTSRAQSSRYTSPVHPFHVAADADYDSAITPHAVTAAAAAAAGAAAVYPINRFELVVSADAGSSWSSSLRTLPSVQRPVRQSELRVCWEACA